MFKNNSSFRLRFQKSLENRSANSRKLRIGKNANVYNSGDISESVYFIESGKIKLVMRSPEGKECLLAIYSAGDIFGEQCLAQVSERFENAIAMEDSVVYQMTGMTFLKRLKEDALLESYLKYVTLRVSDQQNLINNLVTENSERRLGKTLLHLSSKLGKRYPPSVIIKHKISHRELSDMVGTTRPRVSKFMGRFRELDLIEMSPDHFIIVKEKNLTTYLSQLG